MRATHDTLRKAGEMITEEMHELGMLDKSERMTVEVGSKTYGRAYRIYRTGDKVGLSDAPLHLGDGFLGMTSGEAYRCLVVLLRTLQAVRISRPQLGES